MRGTRTGREGAAAGTCPRDAEPGSGRCRGSVPRGGGYSPRPACGCVEGTAGGLRGWADLRVRWLCLGPLMASQHPLLSPASTTITPRPTRTLGAGPRSVPAPVAAPSGCCPCGPEGPVAGQTMDDLAPPRAFPRPALGLPGCEGGARSVLCPP